MLWLYLIVDWPFKIIVITIERSVFMLVTMKTGETAKTSTPRRYRKGKKRTAHQLFRDQKVPKQYAKKFFLKALKNGMSEQELRKQYCSWLPFLFLQRLPPVRRSLFFNIYCFFLFSGYIKVSPKKVTFMKKQSFLLILFLKFFSYTTA